MTDWPTLTIHMALPDHKEQSRLTLTLPDGTIDTAILALPFKLEDVPLLLRALNVRQFLDYPTQERLFKSDESRDEQRKMLDDLRRLELLDNDNTVALDVHARVGRLLGNGLLKDTVVRRSLDVLYDAAIHAQGGEIVLRFDKAASILAALPWEVAHDGPQPLLMNKGTLLGCTRVMAFDHVLPPRRPPNERLRVLTVTSYVRMDVNGQHSEQVARSKLKDSVGGLSVDVESLPKATMSALKERLSADPVDVLDYYGHGAFYKGSAVLLMEDQYGQDDYVPANRLRALPGLPSLLVLHACYSGQLDIYELYRSLALGLSDAGVRAVVAMQLTIRTQAVTDFVVPTLYKELAKGQSVQRAVAQVRQALYLGEPDGASWYIPVLYMRQSDQSPYVLRTRTAPPPNPFVGPGAINDSKLFIGCEPHVQQLWTLLRSKGNISIVGKSGSGKSAFLGLIASEGEEKLGARVVWLPLQRELKLDDAKYELAQLLEGQRAKDLTGLLKGKHIILLLDNLDILNVDKNGRDIRTWLRGLCENRTRGTIVQLVTTSLHPLHMTFKDDELQPLHVVMQDKIELGPFTENEVRTFIEKRLIGTPFNLEDFRDLLVAPRLPRELAEVCRDRYNELCGGKST